MDLIAGAVLSLIGTVFIKTVLGVYAQVKLGTDVLAYNERTLIWSIIITLIYYTAVIVLVL